MVKDRGVPHERADELLAEWANEAERRGLYSDDPRWWSEAEGWLGERGAW
jgi:hypothetical protein